MATAATIPVQDLIINKLEKTHGGWGAILNRIQDAAEIALPKKNFETYLKKANIEQEKTEGSDGVLFNGEYFDWREFDSKRLEIVRAYMRYFSESELNMIYSQLKTRRKK